MNFPLFVSNKISKGAEDSFSSVINRIAVITVGLGLSVLILAFMVLFGFKKEIKDKIYSFSGHLIVNKYTLSTSFEETSIVINEELLSQLNDYPLTDRIQPFALKAGLLKTKEEVQGVILKGVDQQFDTAGFSKHLIAGRFPDFSGEKYSTEVALSKKIANYLKLKVGNEVNIFFVQKPMRVRKLQIAGIYETGLEEFDEKIIIGDLGLVRRINNWPDTLAGGLEVFISDTDQLEKAESDLFNSVGINLYVDKVTDRFVQIFDWLNMLNINVVILLTIILFVAGTSIISIMIILIMERTQMIGLLKALGASNRVIQRVFVWKGIRLVARGLLWGNVIGLGLGLIQKYGKVIPLDAANYYMDHVPIVLDVTTILLLNFLILLIIGLTLFVPVSVISGVHPVRAIRFD